MLNHHYPNLSALLQDMNLPELLTFKSGEPVRSAADWSERRRELIEILRREIYGFAPEAPGEVTAAVESRQDQAFAGKATHWSLRLQFQTPKGPFSFPIMLIVPNHVEKPPVFLHIAFQPDIPSLFMPAEEILDQGFAIASLYYQDIAPDAADNFENGLPACYPRDPETGWGKISVWAFAASRVMDHLQTRDDIDRRQVTVVGHSRLGKTALWCGAQDERFASVVSNNSGCSGAALNRGKTGERIADITRVFPFWFCGRYRQYAGREYDLPFDQHSLLALIAPRGLYVSSASEDDWADPKAEFLAALAVSPVYERLGQAGLIAPDQMPESGAVFHQGPVAFHLRPGTHYLSRYDWLQFIIWRKGQVTALRR